MLFTRTKDRGSNHRSCSIARVSVPVLAIGITTSIFGASPVLAAGNIDLSVASVSTASASTVNSALSGAIGHNFATVLASEEGTNPGGGGSDSESLTNAELVSQRRVLYRTHVDSAHVAWDSEKNNFAIQVVDGSTPKDADSVLVRLGPDADSNGREVSRIKLPGSNHIRFLGEPGTVLWNAPAKYYDGWRPVWAGVGVGKEIPDNIEGDVINLEIVGVDGPGWVSVWNGDSTEANEILSTKNPGHNTFLLSKGTHAHLNWTFENPGRYTFKFRAHGHTIAGERVDSDIYEVIWLVGSDEDLNLPAGTTEGAPITTPAEEFEVGEVASEPDNDTDEEDTTEAGEEADPPFEGEYTCAPPGHYDLVINTGEDHSVTSSIHDDEGREYGSYELVVPVPDSAIRTLKLNGYTNALAPLGKDGDKIWVLPETQDKHIPWLGFNTENVDYTKINETIGVRLYRGGFYGPGRMITFEDDGIDPIERIIDSRQTEYSYVFREPSHRHTAYAFNRPGLYEVGFQSKAFFKPEDGKREQDYADNETYFAVGNEAVDKYCPTWRSLYDTAAGSTDSADDAAANLNEETDNNTTNTGDESNTPGGSGDAPSNITPHLDGDASDEHTTGHHASNILVPDINTENKVTEALMGDLLNTLLGNQSSAVSGENVHNNITNMKPVSIAKPEVNEDKTIDKNQAKVSGLVPSSQLNKLDASKESQNGKSGIQSNDALAHTGVESSILLLLCFLALSFGVLQLVYLRKNRRI